MTALDLRNLPPVSEPVERPETFSQTRLGRFDRCPRSAYLELLYGGGPGSSQMDRGTGFHLFAERAIELMYEREEATIPGEVATELADAVMAERLDLTLPTAEQDAVRRMAYVWAESFALGVDRFVGTEVPLEIELGEHLVTCRVDLIEADPEVRSIYVFDWKTSLALPSREEVQESFQGQLYALAILFGRHQETGQQLGRGINDVFYFECYPRIKDEDGKMFRREAVWGRHEIFGFQRSLERNLAAFERCLETGEWPARDGSWCSRCPAPAKCPIPTELRDMPELRTQAEAEELLAARHANKRAGDRMQRALREWVRNTGEPIESGDQIFKARTETRRRVKNWDRFLEALEDLEEFGPDKAPLKLSEHVETTTSVKFGTTKRAKEEV